MQHRRIFLIFVIIALFLSNGHSLAATKIFHNSDSDVYQTIVAAVDDLNFIILDDQILEQFKDEIASTVLENNNEEKVQFWGFPCSAEKEKIVKINEAEGKKDEKIKTLLPQCMNRNKIPIVLVYQGRYTEYKTHSSGAVEMKNILEWVKRVINASPLLNPSLAKVNQLLSQQGSVFILKGKSTGYKNAAKSLAKDFYYHNFVHITDPENQLIEEFNLVNDTVTVLREKRGNQSMKEGGNIYLFQDSIVRNDFVQKSKQTTIDQLLQFYSGFVFLKFPPLPNISNLKESVTDGQQAIFVFCDLSLECVKYWQSLSALISAEQMKEQVYRIIWSDAVLGTMKTFQLFYYLPDLESLNMPFSIVIGGKDQGMGNINKRYVKQISPNDPKQLNEFITRIRKNEEDKFILSSGTPKKNGFYGKGVQKSIQKLSYETCVTQIEKVTQQEEKFYLLFATAFNVNCVNCEKEYSQFKKLASFMQVSEQDYIKFGVMDLMKDQMPISNLTKIPQGFLFLPKKSIGQGIPMAGQATYDTMLRFITIQKSKYEQAQQQSKEEEQNSVPQNNEEL